MRPVFRLVEDEWIRRVEIVYRIRKNVSFLIDEIRKMICGIETEVLVNRRYRYLPAKLDVVTATRECEGAQSRRSSEAFDLGLPTTRRRKSIC